MAQYDIGIDLGTTTIIIAVEGKGVILNQPSVVAVDNRKDQVLAVGDDDNDIEMFQAAGISAAVGNVSDNARPYADYVCRGRQFEGVKEAVAKFC